MLPIIKSIIAKWVDYAVGIAIASAFGFIVGIINYILQEPLSSSSADALHSTHEILRATANMVDTISKVLDIIGAFSLFIFIINLPFAVEKRLRDGNGFKACFLIIHITHSIKLKTTNRKTFVNIQAT